MTVICRVFLVVSILLALVGCSPLLVSESPFVIHENAHGGGSVVAFDVSGQVLASGGWEGRVRLWDTASGNQIISWPAHSDSVNGIVFLDGVGELITAGYDGRITRWSANSRLLQSIDTGVPITHMVAHVASDRMLTGHSDGTVRLWRLADIAMIEVRHLHAGAVRAVAVDEYGWRGLSMARARGGTAPGRPAGGCLDAGILAGWTTANGWRLVSPVPLGIA
jgi:WD40 repeat protein